MSETVQGPDFHPLYRQVKQLLLQRVVSGDWKPGQILPSEAKLAEQFNVSQGTVRKALEEMAAEHVVVRHQGKGTFVTARGVGQPVHFFSMTTADHTPLADRVNTSFHHVVVRASQADQDALEIGPDAEVIRIYRVRAINGTPAICDEIVLVVDVFPGFVDHLDEDPQANTYVIMEKEYGIVAARAEEWLSAVPAESREAEALELELGTPLLKVMRISYGLDGMPVELRAMWVNSTDCHYYNSVS
jgi:GntR family transcriptional regulator